MGGSSSGLSPDSLVMKLEWSCRDKPVIRKALVELDGPAFKAFAAEREEWSRVDCYRSPGPIQFSSACKTANMANITLALETNDGERVYVA